MNVLFDHQSLKVTGSNRSPMAFEIEVKNVNINSLTKSIHYTELQDKFDDAGNQLYLLPQVPIITDESEEIQIETTDDTGNPVMIQVDNRVPLLDYNGVQVQYEIMQTIITPATYDEEGNELTPETSESVSTGQFQKCFTIETDNVQKVDDDNQLLFYETATIIKQVSTEQPDLEITEYDERFVEGLEKAHVDVEKVKMVTFTEDQEQFYYDDIVNFKEQSITNDTFYSSGKLFEKMEGIFNTASIADVGFDFISIPSNGFAMTIPLRLPFSTNIVGFKSEVSTDGLIVGIKTDSDFQATPLDSNKEVIFDQPVEEVYVYFENPTDKRIDLYSFSLLV